MKIIPIILLIFLPLVLHAPPREDVKESQQRMKKDYERDKILEAIMEKESNFNTKAVNRKENAVGILQIRPIMVREVNNILRQRGDSIFYSLSDRLDSTKSVEMYYTFQKARNPEYDPQIACYLWNGGTRKALKMSHQYWLDVQKKL
jgi:hypothetical protein